MLGTSVRIWRENMLSGADVFHSESQKAIENSAVFVVVASPRYVASDFCRKELETFLQAAKGRGIQVASHSRVLRVDKTPVPHNELPPALSSVHGYSFFRLDAAGRAREFFIDDEGRTREYVDRLDDLAYDICRLLIEMREREVRPMKGDSQPGRTVYLAETASDVGQERDQLSRELVARGHQVLPVQTLPLNTGDYVRAVREEMARADLSVHLVGGRRGIVPEGEERSIVELQCEIAVQVSKRCLVWIAPGSGTVPVQRTVDTPTAPARKSLAAISRTSRPLWWISWPLSRARLSRLPACCRRST